MKIPDDLKVALQTLVSEGIGDFTYTIRDRELKGWNGPRVTAWSDAVQVIEKYAGPVEKRREDDGGTSLPRPRSPRSTLQAEPGIRGQKSLKTDAKCTTTVQPTHPQATCPMQP